MIARAIKNAAPAATLPINAVCKALRNGRVPVKRPFTKPKTNSAASVSTIENSRAVVTATRCAYTETMYGARGIKPPATYEAEIVNALTKARFGSGFSKPNSNRIIKSTQRFLSARMAFTTVATVSSFRP